jgi:hypothetical protein
MSLFFKSSTKPELLKQYGLSGNLATRRLQLLGRKLFVKCSLGEPVTDEELEYRAKFLNRTKKIGFTVKDLVSGCKLSLKPADHSKILEKDEDDRTPEEIETLQLSIQTNKLLSQILKGTRNPSRSWEEKENIDFLDEYDVLEAYSETETNLPKDIMNYAVKPFLFNTNDSRSITGYRLFVDENFHTLDNSLSFLEKNAKLRSKWHFNMSEEEKNQYNKRADKLKFTDPDRFEKMIGDRFY